MHFLCRAASCLATASHRMQSMFSLVLSVPSAHSFLVYVRNFQTSLAPNGKYVSHDTKRLLPSLLVVRIIYEGIERTADEMMSLLTRKISNQKYKCKTKRNSLRELPKTKLRKKKIKYDTIELPSHGLIVACAH